MYKNGVFSKISSLCLNCGQYKNLAWIHEYGQNFDFDDLNPKFIYKGENYYIQNKSVFVIKKIYIYKPGIFKSFE
jgi:hypothetical protein